MPKSSLLVLDSSVIIKWLNRQNEPDLSQSDKLLDDLEVGKINIIVPHLVIFEIGNALLKGKRLSLAEAKIAFEVFSSLPLQFGNFDQELLTATYQFGQRYHLTYYDASFLALADKYNISLITANPRHQKKAVKEVKVIALGDY